LPITPDQPTKSPQGVWLGVDVGTVRVGVARSDPSGVLATPLVTLSRDADGGRDLDERVKRPGKHEHMLTNYDNTFLRFP